jgi:hypothetical protein
MKTLLLTLLIAFVAFTSEAQDKIIDTIPKIDGTYCFQEVVTLDGTYKKDFLYKNAKLYFVNNFKSANDVIQYDNKDDAKIIGKGNLTVYDSYIITPFEWRINFSTEITCKDGKYRYRLYDVNIIETRHVSSEYGGDRIIKLTIDDALNQNKKGSVKKVTARLFNKMITSIKADIAAIKIDMAKKDVIAKDDF